MAWTKTPEHCAKISAALTGIKHSPQRRALQSAGQRGKKRGPYKLDPLKDEQRRKRGQKLAAARWGSRVD